MTKQIMDVLKEYDFSPIEILRAALQHAEETKLLSLFVVDLASNKAIKDFKSMVNDFDYIPLWRGGEYPTLKAAQHDGAAYTVKVPRGTDLEIVKAVLSACGDCYNGDHDYFTISDK